MGLIFETKALGKSSWVKRMVEPLESAVTFDPKVCLENHFRGPSPCLNLSFLGFQRNSKSVETFLPSVAEMNLLFNISSRAVHSALC